jgi:hypothetical protein
MASISKNGSSLRKPHPERDDESWKTAPSRETTHDAPDGKDIQVDTERRRLENAPGLVPRKEEKDQ